MNKAARNTILGLVTLLLIAAVYVILSMAGRTKPLFIEKPPQPVKSGSNIAAGQMGKIGDVNITDLNNPVYRHVNDAGFVDRIITFSRILHAVGDKWQVEKPQISFLRPDLSVVVSADKADIQTETVLKQPRPKDASLSGNVLVHIQPKGKSQLQEGFIYLDSISFESESSRAFSNGSLKFVSGDIELTGSKMEFVYNGQIGRLEFFKIDDLNSIKFKVPAKSFSFEPKIITDANAEGSAAVSSNIAVSSTSEIKHTNTVSAANMLYRCFLNNTVCIDSNSEIVLTDQLTINNILINQSPSKEDTNEPNTIKKADPNKNSGSDKKTGELMPVTITCKGGILITPMDSPRAPQKITATESVIENKLIEKYPQVKNKAFVQGRQLTFDVISSEALLAGDCRAKILKPLKFLDQRYTLLAQRIRAAFFEKTKNLADSDLKFVKADGGIVELDVEKIEEGKTLGFIKIKCSEFNYDPVKQLVWGAGPGLIAVDNSRLTQKEIEVQKTAGKQNKFTLRRPCYALIENFKSLEYNPATGYLLAQSDKERMNIGYLPVIDGKQTEIVKATVGKVEGKFKETDTGSTELVKLYGSGGVTFDEQPDQTNPANSKKIQIVGSDFLYNNENPRNPIISAWGNTSWPCYLNGVRADGIEYNISTGTLKETRILAPIIIW